MISNLPGDLSSRVDPGKELGALRNDVGGEIARFRSTVRWVGAGIMVELAVVIAALLAGG